ncbi:lasso peptide biosynthesis PqqD family chaperone [Bacillus sp. SD075]|uniref:lasso peptide biosynthesis PqqD family chaperone n=1 Tax=Bacillus sp. SD075 TaxID=2781732 RepID=UPI001A95C049|nr:lasso peptide biosynthesis PqqD family chaperone [Bacillus sp. SD075]MBO0996453.1 lasso peptide biosynthesis PqqD family chaperone [Bacillus sp. SD075]
MITNQLDTKYSQSPGNIVSDMDGEKVMLSVSNGKYYNLGELGGEIWELMKEPITIQELVVTLQSQYTVDQTDCKEHVTDFLSQLLEQGLVSVHS